MDQVWGWLLGAVAGGGLLAFVVAPTIRAFAKTPASDLSRIRADFERMQAHPRSGARVSDIARVGARLPTPSKAPRRVYAVALQRSDGSIERWRAEIAVPLVGRGALRRCRE
jgi:hypothetical protein